MLRRARAHSIASANVQKFLDFGGPWGLLDPTASGWFPSQNGNRVIDLGCNGDHGVKLLSEPFKDAGLPRFFVYLDPYPVLQRVQLALHEAGYRCCNEVIVLARNLTGDQIQGHSTPQISIKVATTNDIDDLLRVLTYDGTQDPMWEDKVTGVLSRSGIEVHLATYDERPIAVGVLNYENGLAYLSNATTVPAFRGNGAQKALIHSRLQRAQILGCDLAYVETYRFLAASYNNLLKCGFCDLYSRQIFRYEFDSAIRATLSHTVGGITN